MSETNATSLSENKRGFLFILFICLFAFTVYYGVTYTNIFSIIGLAIICIFFVIVSLVFFSMTIHFYLSNKKSSSTTTTTTPQSNRMEKSGGDDQKESKLNHIYVSIY